MLVSSNGPGSCRPLQRAARLDRAAQRELVGVLQVAAHRQAARQPAHRDAERLDGARQVARRGLALDIGVRGDDDLLGPLRAEPRQQLAHMQLLRADLVDGADDPSEHVVQAAIAPGPLDRRDVARLGDHADARRVARRVPADGALVLGRVVEAPAAEVHLLLDRQDGVGQAAGLLDIGFQQIVRDALRRLGPDARKPAQLVEEDLQTAVCAHALTWMVCLGNE